ncbi:hypothetical protein BDV96DRAFT_610024 [Lophiotrema nucula]|uniref:PRISE-like Rossmann-fold domain-containing protein n=1 Tax=Lophiotrema nucula TaxID=690887 RepID=A0A6A5ZNN7_9PLEO|nr:hypothetical protein BDV96DRAFT_610024 [Lophiotrema nucula]
MSPQTIFSKGNFYGLPAFLEHDGKGYTAIVAGASGITGAYIVQTLAESPSRWKKIYALSRRPPQSALLGNVEHISIDLLDDPQDIGSQLLERGVKADYVFFAAYIQPPPKQNEGLWSDAEETERVNVLLLKNFLSALEVSQSLPRRFLLQTGAKHYGVHIGPTLTPMEESDPRYLRERNFYFPQEDILWDWCKKHNIGWNVTRPGFIVGAVRDAAMNIVHGLAIYASIQKELGRKLEFPGDIAAWEAEKHLSSASLIGYHAEWAVLTEGAENQALNISDDSMFTYGKFWPVLAGWYDLAYKTPKLEAADFQTVTMPRSPPPRGFGGPGSIKASWSFEGWAAKPEVKEAWKKLKDQYGLIGERDPLENAKDYLGIVDIDVLGPWGRSISMGKNRKLGWHGYVDSYDAIFEAITKLEEMKMLPAFLGQRQSPIHYHGY